MELALIATGVTTIYSFFVLRATNACLMLAKEKLHIPSLQFDSQALRARKNLECVLKNLTFRGIGDIFKICCFIKANTFINRDENKLKYCENNAAYCSYLLQQFSSI